MDRASPFIGINVFLACSSKDQPYLNQLCIHLKPLEADGLIRIWDEASILPGARHVTEIERMIEVASVAVLLVSANFLASSEITQHILPLILNKSRLNAMTILPVILGYSAFDYSSLTTYKPINDPDRPLKTMREAEKEKVWQKVAQTIRAMQQKGQPLSHQPKEVNAMPTHYSEDAKPVLDQSSLVQLSEAILHAYPSTSDLKIFIAYELRENIEVVAPGNSLAEKVYSLVVWAISAGKEKTLIDGALHRNPGNPKLKEFASKYGF